MIIDLTKVSEGTFAYEYTPTANFLDKFLCTMSAPIKISGEYQEVDEGILVTGNMKYTLEYNCARCLETVNNNYSVDFGEIYTLKSDDDYHITDDKIDITPIIEENIILNINYRVLCNEDCKGLCPECGTNLNNNKCNCNTSIDDISGDNPFAVLRDYTTGGAEDGSTKKKNV